MNINEIISQQLSIYADRAEAQSRLTNDPVMLKEIADKCQAVTEFTIKLADAIETEKLLNAVAH